MNNYVIAPKRFCVTKRAINFFVLWGFTHTQAGGGKEGENREKTTKAENRQGAHNKQAEQRKRKGGERGEKAHGTQPWHAEEQTARSRTGNKEKTQQRDT